MALNVNKGTLTSPGATGNVIINVGAGFAPKAIILWAAYDTADGGAAADGHLCYGFGTFDGGAVQQGCVAVHDDDATANATCSIGTWTDSVLRGIAAAGTASDYEIDLVAMDDDEVTLNWVDLPGVASQKIHYLILGGSDLTAARAHSFTDTAVDPQDVTVVAGFGQPDLLLFAATQRTTAGQARGDGGLMLGAAKSPTERYSCAVWMDDAAGTMDIETIAFDRALGGFNAGGIVTWQADLATKASWPTDGYRLSYPDTGAGYLVIGLALKGSFAAAVGSTTTLTAGSTQDLALGSTPVGALLFGLNQIAAQSGTGTAGGQWIGGTDLTTEGAAGWLEDDGAASAFASRWHRTDKALSVYLPGGSGTAAPAADAQADATASGTNVRLTYTTLSASPAKSFGYVLLGSGAAGGAALTQGIDDTLSVTDAASSTVGKAIADTAGVADALAQDVAKAIADTAAVTDARSLEAGKALADTAGVADAATPEAGKATSVNDPLGVADAQITEVGYGRTIPDTLNVADARALDVAKAIADTAGVADAIAKAIELAAIADTAGVADSATAERGIVQGIDDSAGAADNVTTAGGKGANIDDTLGVADAASSTVGKAIADSLGAVDALSMAAAIAVADPLGVADNLTAGLAYALDLADSAGVADARTLESGKGADLADSLGVSDALTVAMTKALADALAAGDALTLAVAVAIADNVPVADARGIAVSRILADALPVADLATPERGRALSLDDAIAVADLLDTLHTPSAYRPRRPGHLTGALAGAIARLSGHRAGSPGGQAPGGGHSDDDPGDVELLP